MPLIRHFAFADDGVVLPERFGCLMRAASNRREESINGSLNSMPALHRRRRAESKYSILSQVGDESRAVSGINGSEHAAGSCTGGVRRTHLMLP